MTRPLPERPFLIIEMDSPHITSLLDNLESEARLALDTESDSFHRYHDKVCLIQISTSSADCILDPLVLGMPDAIRHLLESDRHLFVLHGADFDVRSLKKSFGLRLGPLFDTHIAASLLGFRELGLKALLASELGIEIRKDEQRSDWGRRPLTDEQLEYARLDTRHLLPLAERLEEKLRDARRLHWLEEECARLREVPPFERTFDPEGHQKIKGARALRPKARSILRAIYVWREQGADRLDVAPFRVMRNDLLVRLAAWAEGRRESGSRGRAADLSSLKWLPRGLDFDSLAAAVEAGLATPVVSPTPPGRPAGRLDEDTQRRFDRLLSVRAVASARLGLDPGFFLGSGLLRRIAIEAPTAEEQLLAVEGMTRWRREAVGDALLEVIYL